MNHSVNLLVPLLLFNLNSFGQIVEKRTSLHHFCIEFSNSTGIALENELMFWKDGRESMSPWGKQLELIDTLNIKKAENIPIPFSTQVSGLLSYSYKEVLSLGLGSSYIVYPDGRFNPATRQPYYHKFFSYDLSLAILPIPIRDFYLGGTVSIKRGNDNKLRASYRQLLTSLSIKYPIIFKPTLLNTKIWLIGNVGWTIQYYKYGENILHFPNTFIAYTFMKKSQSIFLTLGIKVSTF